MTDKVNYGSGEASENDIAAKEIERLREQFSQLLAENEVLKKICRDNEIEVEGVNKLSDAERICLGGIRALLPFFEKGSMTDTDSKIFDTLHKNLMAIRKYDVPKEMKSKKSLSKEDLLKVIQGG